MSVNNVELYIYEKGSVEGRPMDIKIESVEPVRDSKMPQIPLEGGTVYADNKVVMPMTISVHGYIACEDYDETYSTLLRLWKSRELPGARGLSATIVGKGEDYSDLMLVKMPHKENSDKHDVVEITLNFYQPILLSDAGMPSSESDSDTVDTGMFG